MRFATVVVINWIFSRNPGLLPRKHCTRAPSRPSRQTNSNFWGIPRTLSAVSDAT